MILRLEWPKKYQVLAPGRRADVEARERGRLAANWTVERASFGVTFEVGEYETYRRKVGDFEVTLALDEISAVILNDTEVLFDYIEEPLVFLQDVFGELAL